MICPYCGGDTRVLPSPRRNRVVLERLRLCLECGERFLTKERYTKRYTPRPYRRKESA